MHLAALSNFVEAIAISFFTSTNAALTPTTSLIATQLQ